MRGGRRRRSRACEVGETVRTSIGFPAWVLWLVVHLAALTGFKHRLSVFFNWTVSLLGGGRAERVIALQQVFGRHAMAEGVAVPRPAARGA